MHSTAVQVTGLLNPDPNPFIAFGALVQGMGDSDAYIDSRQLNSSKVQVDMQAGLHGALAGVSVAPGTWEQCLQGTGVLINDNVVC